MKEYDRTKPLKQRYYEYFKGEIVIQVTTLKKRRDRQIIKYSRTSKRLNKKNGTQDSLKLIKETVVNDKTKDKRGKYK